MRPLHKIYCLILLGFWQSGRLLIAYNYSICSGSLSMECSSVNELRICIRAIRSAYFNNRSFWAITISSFTGSIPSIIKSAETFSAKHMSFNVLTFTPLRPCSSIEMKLRDLSIRSANCSCVRPAFSRASLILRPMFSLRLIIPGDQPMR